MQTLIETDRLLLRPMQPDDAPALYELDTDADVHQYLTGQRVTTPDETRALIQRVQLQYAAHNTGRVTVVEKATGAVTGWAGLKLVTDEVNGHTNYYDVGYRFLKRYWGRGYATEAAQASIQYGWQKLKLTEQYAMAHVDNLASRRVLEKVGMQEQNTFDDMGVPHVWYKIERPKLVYRRGSAAEKAELMEVALRSYSEYATVLTADNYAAMHTNMLRHDRWDGLLGQAATFVCMCGDRIAGSAYLVPSGTENPIFDKTWSHIRMVGVLPEYRGYGIARELTLRCIAYARETGEHTIALHTSEFMDAARHVYESLGFKRLKEIDPIFGKRYWVYTLNLTA